MEDGGTAREPDGREGSEGKAFSRQHKRSVRKIMVGTAETLPLLGVEARDYPKLLVLDLTKIGSDSATGQVKSGLFAGWPEGKLAQVFGASPGHLRFWAGGANDEVTGDREAMLALARTFSPDVIYARPVADRTDFEQTLYAILESLPNVPVVTHIMDDWMERLRHIDPEWHTSSERRLRWLLERSTARLSISAEMSAELWRRYGVRFRAVANCVDPSLWLSHAAKPPAGDAGDVCIRYSGALASDMTREAVLEVAEAVEVVARETPVRFEVAVLKPWWEQARRDFAHLSSTVVQHAERPPEEYRAWLAEADICVVAYNFDASAERYARLSMANKLPDYLAAGRPVLAYGPAHFATMRAAGDAGAVIVDKQKGANLAGAIRQLATDPARRAVMSDRARQFAFTQLNCRVIRNDFQRLFLTAGLSRQQTSALSAEHPRSAQLNVDECAVVARLLKVESGSKGLMIDVGAHQGSSLAPFLAANWDVVALEPDEKNRTHLLRRFGSDPHLRVDARAASDIDAAQAPFFTSPVSTGISALRPFTDSHKLESTVRTVRLASLCEEYKISEVDFLKIDTEGYDLPVLKGYNWSAPPKAIVCEFENLKTIPLGYKAEDLADFLVDQGYTVWVSEWHPVREYGVGHDWRRLRRYPCAFASERAWGNLLAFLSPPTDEELESAFLVELGSRLYNYNGQAVESRIGIEMGSHNLKTRQISSLRANVYTEPARGRATIAQAGKEIIRAFQGRLAMPATLSATLFAAGLIIAALGFDGRVAAILLALGGEVMLILLAASILRGRRERDRAGAMLQSELGVILSRLRDAVAFDVNDVAARVDRVQDSSRALEQDLAALQETYTRIENRLEKDAADRSAIVTPLESLTTKVSNMERTVSEIQEHSRHEKEKVVHPRGGYQPFSRGLVEADINLLTSKWAMLLGVRVSGSELQYLVEHFWKLELQARGRVACSAEALVLRAMVARAALCRVKEERGTLGVLEIGTMFGLGIGMMYEACRDRETPLHLTVVDPLEGYYGHGPCDPITGVPISEAVFRENMKRLAIPDGDYTLLRGRSPDALERHAQKQNVVVLDGDHSASGLHADVEVAVPLMADGGYLIIDDYGNDDWPEVKKLVDSELMFNPSLQFLGSDFGTVVFRKV